ncbi:TerB family tellurite resistance protein [Gloeobacter morelensis]|uniref:TerB family tellurite resistance protein n=1 Tax=Gloeobacter morelensis MG652769 TaxID=2781736 RepID=A0ABY3PJ42_9CYAN|nr:TerB family tellurite resistance protein [Gloeobacter morelensis]UFP93573.1 TerB family tellurite resistance protein [Gloeobacter morelensis MG652769]
MTDFFDSIQPLVVYAEQQGSTLQCTFRCPLTGETVAASAYLQKRETAMSGVAQSVGTGMLQSLKYSVGLMIRSALGYGFMGRILGDASDTLLNQGYGGSQPRFSEEERKDALVQAFQASNFFIWDGRQGGWISASAARQLYTDFEQQLSAYPVEALYDRSILARMLMAVARADGRLAEQERAFVAQCVDPQFGSPDSPDGAPPPSPVELEETAEGPARETMLMLAWSLALTDEHLDASETALLDGFADGLGIDTHRRGELMHWAQVYLLERVIGQCLVDGKLSRQYEEQIGQWAPQIGLGTHQIERAIVQYKKRHHLV